MESDETKAKPIVKDRVGHFQLSLWKQKRVIPAKHGFDVEREVESVRVCIQYSRFSRTTRTWENQSVWCFPEDLRDLSNLLSKMNEENGGDKTSHSS